MARKQDWSPSSRRIGPWKPKAGDRVILTDVVDRYPDAVAHAGEMGTIVEFDPPHIVRVRLDLHHPGLDEWGNEIHFYDYHLEAGEFQWGVERLPLRVAR